MRIPDLARRVAAPVRTAREENDALRARVADLEAEVDGMRQECRADLGYLFIVTYGRSGSTLLQGILNAIPGYLIRGENLAMPYRLHRYHQASVTTRRNLARPNRLAPTHPFFGIDDYPDDLALRDMRRLMLDTILRPEPDTRVSGFKEIRWNQKDVRGYARFLAAVFPGARFLINTRDHAAVSQSKWWAKKPDALAEIQDREDRLLTVLADQGDRAFHVHYDDYVDDPGSLAALFDWLGEDFVQERVAEVLATRHSY